MTDVNQIVDEAMVKMVDAERVVEARENISLSATDWDAFYGALVDPSGPNEKLRRAVRRYRERVGR